MSHNSSSYERHTVKSVSEMLAQRTATDSQMSDSRTESGHKTECDKHSQSLSIYCVTCQDVVCPGCLEDHLGHTCLDVKTAAEKDKSTINDKAGQLENVVRSIEWALTRCGHLRHYIKENQCAHLKSIESAYTAGLTALNNWKTESEKAVKMRYCGWSAECGTWTKALKTHKDEAKVAQQSCKNLLSSLDLEIVQLINTTGSKQLTERIKSQLSEVRSCLKTYNKIQHKFQDCVGNDPVVYVDLILQKGPSKPKLIFPKTDCTILKITDNGSKVECGEHLMGWRTVLTDGCFETDRHYWEMEISLLGKTSFLFWPKARVGVLTQPSYMITRDLGRECWYVEISHNLFGFRCSSDCGGDVNPPYQSDKPHAGTHYLGLYLNCHDKSLTVLDLDKDDLIFTVSGIDFSGRLVPFVAFANINSASARLVTGASAILPEFYPQGPADLDF